MRFRIEVAEGKLLQLVAHVLHAHATGERRIDVHRLFGDAGALFRRHVVERAHIVQPVGQLDEEHAHIVGNRQKQLAEIFRLLGALRYQIELLDLGQAFDKDADILAEQAVDLVPRRGRVLDRVVQERNGDGRFIEAHIGEDRGHFERMGNIRIAAGPLLLAVLLHGIDVSLVQQGLVDVRLVSLHALHELVLAHHVGRTPAGRSTRAARGHQERKMRRRRTGAQEFPYNVGVYMIFRKISNRRFSPAARDLRCRREALPRTSGRR
jgi:hypothetical protein